MRVVARFDFNGGEATIRNNYPQELDEITAVIGAVDATACKTKESHEKTMPGQLLYSPKCLNALFKEEFSRYGWHNRSVPCEYRYGTFLEGYTPSSSRVVPPYRDMDFIRPGSKLGVEVQFGKYSFMVYNVCAKMTIFRNLGIIDAGIEIVPVKHLADEMSTGVSYFEQIAWDLTMRGVSNIDVPVLILGIDA